MNGHGKPYIASECLLSKFKSPFKTTESAKESGILYRYPADMHYNKYNFITVTLNTPSKVELAVMSEMVKNMKYVLT